MYVLFFFFFNLNHFTRDAPLTRFHMGFRIHFYCYILFYP